MLNLLPIKLKETAGSAAHSIENLGIENNLRQTKYLDKVQGLKSCPLPETSTKCWIA